MVSYTSTKFKTLRLVLISLFFPCHKTIQINQAQRLYRGNGENPLRQLLRLKLYSSPMMKSHMLQIITTRVSHPQDFITVRMRSRDLSATSDMPLTTWVSFTLRWMYMQPWQQGSLLPDFLLWTASIQAIQDHTGSPLSTLSPRARKKLFKAGHTCLRYQWWRL